MYGMMPSAKDGGGREVATGEERDETQDLGPAPPSAGRSVLEISSWLTNGSGMKKPNAVDGQEDQRDEDFFWAQFGGW